MRLKKTTRTRLVWRKKHLELCLKLKTAIGYVDLSTNPCSLTLQKFLFIQYIHSLEPDEIKQLDDNIKTNGWGIESVVNIKNYFELLRIFQLFC